MPCHCTMPLSMIVTGRRQFTLGMSRNNFDQCVFYIVVFPEKRLLQFNLFPPHVCLRTCGSSLIFIQVIWTSYPFDLFDCRTKIFIVNFIAVIYFAFYFHDVFSAIANLHGLVRSECPVAHCGFQSSVCWEQCRRQ